MSLLPVFAAVSVVNIISATMNMAFLISSRHFLQPTQYFAPWLLGSSICQAVRSVVLATGQNRTTVLIYDVISTIGLFMGFTYFVLYILLLLKQAHVVAGRELDQKKVYAYYFMHSLLVGVSLMDLVGKNLLHNTMITGIKDAYYLFYTFVYLGSIDYLGYSLIRFATINATKIEVLGGQSLKSTLLRPLQRTLIFFSFVCLFGIIVFFISMLRDLRTPEYFPQTELPLTELVPIILLSILNFMTTLHAWIYLDRCERRRGKDTRPGKRGSTPATKREPSSTQAPTEVGDTLPAGSRRPSAQIRRGSENPAYHTHTDRAHSPDLELQPVTNEITSQSGEPPTSAPEAATAATQNTTTEPGMEVVVSS